MRLSRFAFLIWMLLCLVPAVPCSAQRVSVVISEFVAFNTSGLRDEDGEFSDWIELFNASNREVNLEGWVLTDSIDSPFKWIFPDVTIGPRQFLVVFASLKNRAMPGSELHTNFALERNGEFLALLTPDGDFATAFRPGFPFQMRDVSYGLSTDSTLQTPVAIGAPARVLVPSNGDLGLDWTALDFDDSGWTAGTTAVGYGGPAAQEALIGTNVESMRGVVPSVFIRIPFEVADPAGVDLMTLSIRYDDGFVAFINGQEVVRENAPEELAWNSDAVRSHSGGPTAKFDLSEYLSVLQPGRNVLAIQGLNVTVGSSDLFVLPEIELIDVGEVDPTTRLYFAEPSPGAPNRPGVAEIAPSPEFSIESGAFVEPPVVELSTDLPDAVIRFTLNGSLPDETSEQYTGPIEVNAVSRVTARVFADGMLPSPPVSRTYVVMVESLRDFSSNLPLVVCSTFGRQIGGNCGGGPYTPGNVMLFMPGDDGRTRLTDPAHFTDSCGFRRRGSSTCGRQKFSMNLTIWDEDGVDKTARLIPDFPAESDYILYGPYNFDRALMRNPIAYWMSREAGWWAAKTRFVEIYVHQRPGPLTNASYHGVYVLMEKNKRHPEKVDLEQLTPGDNDSPNVQGGYMLRRDRVGQGEIATSAGGYGNLVFVYPKNPTGPQRAWITNYINRAIASLSPNIGSQADNDLIDFNAFVDHHILNWYPKNVDAFRLSGYMHKKRKGGLAMGPVWDYDRTMGCSDDDRAREPTGWDNTASGDGGTRYFQAGGLGSWYSHLFNSRPPQDNSPWAKAYRARWRELRKGPLRTENILAQIDEWGDELSEAQARNFTRWSAVRPRFGGFRGEVNHLKNWLATRADWIDQQFIATPVFSHPGGEVEKGLQVSIRVDSNARIYYTLDGADPRASRGAVSESAFEFRNPITITRNTKITARALEDGLWSPQEQAIYVTEILPIVYTEIMYNPPPDPTGTFSTSDFEYVELQNVGEQTIDVSGVSIGPRARFQFPEGTMLARGQIVVIARNAQAFASRYPNVEIAGEFDGTLSNTRQEMEIIGAIGEVFQSFRYLDDWEQDLVDGGGHSLVIRDPFGPRELWNEEAGWRASKEVGGSPGRPDIAAEDGRQVPGDLNQDGRFNTTDVVGMLRYLFQGEESLPCFTEEANIKLLDFNGDADTNIADVAAGLRYLFQRGTPHVLGERCTTIASCAAVCDGTE